VAAALARLGGRVYYRHGLVLAEEPFMDLRWITTAALAALAGCADRQDAERTADVDGSTPGAYTAPRTPWGDPDLRGMWPIDRLNGTPVQRPEAFGERRFLTDEEYAERVERLRGLNARYDQEIANNKMGIGHWAEMGEPNRLTSLIMEPANGRLPPLTAEGERRSATMTSSWSNIPFDRVADFNPLDRCITRGLPASMFPFMYNSGIEIMQSPGYVVIRLEIVHETRIVPLDGRPALDPAIRQWLGESRGRWEGTTLVIETTNFNGESPMLIVGPGAKPIPTSEQLRIVERLTRTAQDTIDYQLYVEDPVTLTAPWRAAFPLILDPAYRFFEYACHEDNSAIRNYIEASRYERAQQAAGAPR
jgi:hypothetical protein